ncbi:MAG: alanine--tRNA ligase [Candidatus Muiribacteriota bacterium]
MKSNDIREKFLSFFENRGHKKVKSASLLPVNDPTLLFTNAGMNQFKEVFEGKEKREYKKAVSCQKCVRAGGKHNDLDNVGYTARHQTFFEMLGNFSFGDYFKKEAIKYAWEFLTEVLNIPENKLYISVHRDDEEAFKIWNEKMQIDKKRIYRLGDEDNFWAMGPTGPCGPNSEIFYDFGPEYGCNKPDCQVGCECDRYVEIWNNVFMEFERQEDGSKKKLPNPGIDTGMGLERLAAVMQGVHSNYEIDIFQSIIKEIEKITDCNYKNSDEKKDISFRVVADHLRCSVFLISDGILPGNEGRNYVLRRIIRRAVRYGNALLNEPFMYKLVDIIVKEMGAAYAEIKDKKDFIIKIIKKEEELFFKTLKLGIKILEDMVDKHKKNNKNIFSGKDAFVLYDTYGFPLDLTEIILKEKNLKVDNKEFEEAMQEQIQRSQKSWKGGNLKLKQEEYYKLRQQTGKVEFAGYDSLSLESEIIYSTQNFFITRKTPFYGEGGGQAGDTGKVFFRGTEEVDIVDTKKPVEGLIVHIINKKIDFKKGETVKLAVDKEKRLATQRNHSATHLLHKALRNIIGNHAEQSGSYVDSERLRFDFKHFEPLTEEQLNKIELLVNNNILKNNPVKKSHHTIEEARELGATALFGEKYGERVRVVQMGESMELCGGCHVDRTGDIGLFKIISETSIAASVRRIEAVCGLESLKYINDNLQILSEMQKQFKVPAGELPRRVNRLKEDIKNMRKEINDAKADLNTAGDISGFKTEDVQINILTKEGLNKNQIREACDKLVEGKEKNVAVVLSAFKNNVNIAIKVTKDISDKFHAGKLMKETASFFGGKGGGRAEMAQGAGKDTDKINNAVDYLKKIILEKK